ncbi:Gfo/Idh/MocA family protein [Halogeometricum luteum]|uniref:Gfo/Idh/MocA family oxidoreductase n=1 Tax=Halogeometricum luteum TaxID=2950537 RepID=A0ABU2G2Z0_9EURY|nr:Gfo/Idh/MocA family oxidoreductase [Halogeometricum sp. S3BR5-2]MDS0295143.1 Gfo/Idh/MocA family oxidoreductase [Halogeometricum sp. S3BR5-2]
MTFRIGFVGTGDPDGDGFAMAYRHAAGYERLDDCELVACADVVPENAEAFADAHDIDAAHTYEDYEEMLAEAEPDVVSVCVPPALHADIVVGVAQSGVVEAIHCEKPMADTWEDAQRMVEECEAEGVALTVNHQQRFGKPYRKAKDLLDTGKVGDLRRIEFREEHLYDTGTHAFDLANFYNDMEPVDWVLAQIDYTDENVLFGAHNENQALAQWRYENGVYGLASTGRGEAFAGDALFRLLGTEGEIEVRADGTLAYRRDGKSWKTVDTGIDGRYRPQPGRVRAGTRLVAGRVSSRLAERLGSTTYTERAIAELIGALRDGEESELNGRNALAADELIFASWESSRRRGRVDLPLEAEDNALESMVEEESVGPDATERSYGDEAEESGTGGRGRLGSLRARFVGSLGR